MNWRISPLAASWPPGHLDLESLDDCTTIAWSLALHSSLSRLTHIDCRAREEVGEGGWVLGSSR